MIAGEPMVGISTNGTSRLPTMAPVVFTASSDPDSPPAVPASSRSRIGRGREGDPQHDGHGQHDEQRRPEQRLQGLDGLPGIEGLGTADDEHQPQQHQAADHHLAQGQQPERVPEPRADQAEDQGADGDPGEEGRQDHREDIRRVAGPGCQEARPGDLVGERREPRDERDGERQPRPRHEPGPDEARAVVRRARVLVGSRASDASVADAALVAAVARQPDGRDAGDGGAGRPHRERPGQAEELDQDQARGQRPDDGPDACWPHRAARTPGSARWSGRDSGSGSGRSRP